MTRRRWACSAIAALGVQGCTHSLHVNHTGDFRLAKPLAEHRWVEARGEQTVILGLVGNTDYVDSTHDALQEACPGGIVTGIQTRYSSSLNFLHWTNKIVMIGYCSE